MGGRAAPWDSQVLLLEVGDHPPTPASQSATWSMCWAWAWLVLWSGGRQHRGVVGEPGLGEGRSR